MVRTVEVGRAVLAPSAQHLELWLGTLITILPVQHSIDIEQLSSHLLLNFLSSGNVWVGRGRGLRVEIILTLRGETFPQQAFQELMNMILQASVWSQLKLEPIIQNDAGLQDGVAHISVVHCEDNGSYTGQKRHRIFDNVPGADLRPPENVANMQLEVVRFSMDILEPKQRPQLRRSNTSAVGSESSSQHPDPKVRQDHDLDEVLQEPPSPNHGLSWETATHSPSPNTAPTDLKRKRSDIRTATHAISPAVVSRAPGLRKRNLPGKTATSLPTASDTLSGDQLTEIYQLIDAGMRLSICGTSKLSSGIKIKANTFVLCLADIAPVVWRPGYLGALAQRAHLLPTITQSIVHTAGTRAKPMSLSEKLQALNGQSSIEAQGRWQGLTAETGKLRLSSVANKVWLHLQKSLLTKAMPQLQSFITQKQETIDQTHTNELLDTTPLTVTDQQHNAGSETICTDMEVQAPFLSYMPNPISFQREHLSSLGVSENTDPLALSLNEQAAPGPSEVLHYSTGEDLLFHECREDIA